MGNKSEVQDGFVIASALPAWFLVALLKPSLLECTFRKRGLACREDHAMGERRLCAANDGSELSRRHGV